MTETISKLEKLMQSGSAYIATAPEAELRQRPNPEKWSKKEILGHLIDSAINNLKRFTEIQFETKPYKITPYKQAELVKANDYQNGETQELLQFWLSLNTQISRLMGQQTEQTLNYKIDLYLDTTKDLRFLMEDYVDHLEHHINQIIK